MVTNSTEAPKEDNPSNVVVDTKEKKDRVLICQKRHKEKHFARDCKANMVNDK